jgi:N utilization substance protein A
MNGELLRLVDAIHRDKNIDREVLLEGIEQALASAARKVYGSEQITVLIHRETGEISAQDGETPINPVTLGRIAAQTAKQVMIQKIREAERDVIFEEYQNRKGQLVTGTVQRFEGGSLIVNLGKTEGILPRSEQIPGEVYQPGDRIRVLVLDVRKVGPRVKIILSRTHPDLIRRLFELEVPEVSEKIIEIKGLSREAGQRTKIAVSSIDSRVDCVGACVGVRGSRIKNIVDELNGEKIDIVRWNNSAEVLIMAALKPAEISSIELDPENRRARVIVPEDQLSLAIGKKGQNVRLASKLSGWSIDIVSEAEAAVLPTVEAVQVDYSEVPGIGPQVSQALADAGIRTLREIFDAGQEGLTAVEGIGPAKAGEIIKYAAELYEQLASEAMARARAGAREATPPTPRQILESMLPEAEGEKEAGGEQKATPPGEPAGESEPGETESREKAETTDKGNADAPHEKESAGDAQAEGETAGDAAPSEGDARPTENASAEDEKTSA